MMETDIMVGTAMKLTCSREEFVARLGVVSRAVSTRELGADPRRRAAARSRRRARSGCDRHGAVAAHVARGARSKAKGSVVVPGRLLVDLARLLPDAGRAARASRGGRRADRRVRNGELPAAHVQRGGLPAPAGDRRHADLHRRRGGAARDRRAGVALGLARRIAPGADRDPRALRAGQARDGRNRFVQARGQGNGPRGVDAGARGDHPGARAHGARAHRRRARRNSSSACRRTRLRSGPTTPC